MEDDGTQIAPLFIPVNVVEQASMDEAHTYGGAINMSRIETVLDQDDGMAIVTLIGGREIKVTETVGEFFTNAASAVSGEE